MPLANNLYKKAQVRIALIMERMMLNSKAHQKFLTLNPDKIASTSMMIKAFMTRINKPSVRMVIGMVRKIRTGRTIALTTLELLLLVTHGQNS